MRCSGSWTRWLSAFLSDFIEEGKNLSFSFVVQVRSRFDCIGDISLGRRSKRVEVIKEFECLFLLGLCFGSHGSNLSDDHKDCL
jgi:hypothetical protein